MPKSKIVELPIIKDKSALEELINDKLAQNRMNAVFEEFEILKYYLNSEYEDSLKSSESDEERCIITQYHQEDLEDLNHEFGFLISEIQASHQRKNLLRVCLKRYGIERKTSI